MANGQQDLAGAIRPTLFIGLGGTGKEVLLRLRRKFYERFGESGLPCVAYLWLDTDTKDHMAQGEPMDEIFRAVAFKEHERIPLLEGKVRESLSGVFLNKSQWEHIHKWLYPEVERFGSEIADGAGGVRAVGRLTFFYHYANAIDQNLRNILQQISTQEVIDKTEERIGHADFDTSPQVFVIASVAGGTGCGTFLDQAFLLKKLSQEFVGLDRIFGILFLPNVYYPNASGEVAQRSYGNAYAALKELEFYTLRRKEWDQTGKDDKGLSIDFEVEWEKGMVKRIQGPPFSVTYLLERRNEGDIGLQTPSELFQMAAESLFLDFIPGAFSTGKRSHYSNVTQYLSGPDGHSISHEGVALPQVFARRYASFGMSKLEIPIDLIKAACASQLSYEIVKHWGRETSAPNVRTQVLEDMAQGERTYTADGLLMRFGTDWRETIKAEVDRIFRGLNIKEVRNIDALANELESFERKVLREEGSDSTRWGTVIASIRGRTQEVIRVLRNDLLEWLKSNLEDSSRGLKSLLREHGYLRHFAENLKALCESQGDGGIPEFEIRRQAAQRDVELWRAERERNQRELKSALRSSGVGLLMVREWTIHTLTERLKDAEQQYALARAELSLLDEAKKVTKAGVDFLQEKRLSLQKFMDSLDAMAENFRQRKEGFLDFGEGVLFIRFFDEVNDWPAFYALGVDGEGRRIAVNSQQENRRFLEREYEAQATLWSLIDAFPREGETALSRRLIRFCEERFIRDFDAYPREVNVLENPKLKEKKSIDETITKLVRCALPMVSRDGQLGGQSLKVERWAYLGIAKTETEQSEPYATFISRVKEQLQSKGYAADHINVFPTGKPWEVYLYLVSYAFPLPSLKVVKNDCHSAYYGFYKVLRAGGFGEQKFHIPLHLSAQWEGKFDDLVVYGDKEAREIKQALDVLLFGSILRVLDLRKVNGRLEYGYKKWIPPASRREALGTRSDAIDALRGNGPFREMLLRTAEQREKELQDDELHSFYWLLSYLRFGEVFPLFTPERTLVESKLIELGQKLAAASQQIAGYSLDHLPEEEQLNETRRRLGDSAEWIGSFPVLKNLDIWIKRE